MNKKTLEKQFEKLVDTLHFVDEEILKIIPAGIHKDIEKIKQFWFVSINEILEDYTNWLIKNQYSDCDVIFEEPKAVDRFLKKKGFIKD